MKEHRSRSLELSTVPQNEEYYWVIELLNKCITDTDNGELLLNNVHEVTSLTNDDIQTTPIPNVALLVHSPKEGSFAIDNYDYDFDVEQWEKRLHAANKKLKKNKDGTTSTVLDKRSFIKKLERMQWNDQSELYYVRLDHQAPRLKRKTLIKVNSVSPDEEMGYRSKTLIFDQEFYSFAKSTFFYFEKSVNHDSVIEPTLEQLDNWGLPGVLGKVYLLLRRHSLNLDQSG